MDMPQPTDGHRRLERLAGSWEGTETMYPSQWDPEGGTATGRTESRVALGGFAVTSDYQQRRDGVATFSGHGVYTFDPKTGQYTLHWFDVMGSPPEVFTGGFIGDVLELSHGGPGMHVRMRWDFTRNGRIASSMEMSKDGMTWSKLFDGDYRQVR
jgi:uncharacterized protein YodC (DUF2158 family)